MRKLTVGGRRNGDAKDSGNQQEERKHDVIEPELYYLIARFLSQGPCKEIGTVSQAGERIRCVTIAC